MNYTQAKDLCVSGFIDSSNDNASTCFCFTSDSIHEPDNIFKPCFNIFLAALKSLSCVVLHE